jgi:nucleoside-specific outer membrane channel protein Tsx
VGSDTRAGDYFGSSVAISGTTAIVGAPGHAGAGRAYVFSKTASGWQQTAELKGSSTIKKDQFGTSVAVSGTTAIVGADSYAHGAGAAYVFAKTASSWKQVAELKGSDAVAHDSFGYSVAISGTTAVVGAWGHANGAGRAYVFMKTRSGWKQAAELKGSNTVGVNYFGESVGVSGSMAIVGAWGHAKDAGRAYVFAKTAGVWKQTAELRGSDTVTWDAFGDSVAISGTTAVVGAFGHANNAGRAYVFEA